MRKTLIAPHEIYHVYNRGVGKQTLFKEDRDYVRFLFGILFLQSPVSFPQLGRHISAFVKSPAFDITTFSVDEKNLSEITTHRWIELIGFCIMPNHFHLLVQEKEDKGLARYMHKVETAYGKYFSIKYKSSGHVFQNAYGATHIESNDELLYVSTYIHRNPRALQRWTDKEYSYPWSSYQDFAKRNRWSALLNPSVIVEQFRNPEEYRKFTQESVAKETEILDQDLMFPRPR